VENVVADVRDADAVRRACAGVDVVLNNVAQVPLAKDKDLFWSVNVAGTGNVLVAARDAGVRKVVHTSSSAIFGIPDHNPVDESTAPKPLEAYGRAKTEAEALCRDAAASGLDVSIVRPRTILGHGRLGIMAVLFELVEAGAPVFVMGSGDNRYQLVHAEDLADAVLRVGDRAGAETYNIGADDFGTMRETLTELCEHAATGAHVVSVPVAPARIGMKVLSTVGLAPFAPYHWLLYSESLWFDTTKAHTELDWTPRYSNGSMVIESYEWFRTHKDEVHGVSHHQSPVKLGAMNLLKRLPL
jgi:nucleoside-diphosphate-sugar epimerase